VLWLQAFQLERDQRQASITRRELKISEMVGSKESLAQQLEAAQAELQRQRREIEQLMETVKGHLEQEMLLQEMLRGREVELQVHASPWEHKLGIVSIHSVRLTCAFLNLCGPASAS
jgi:chromosome segregation ATPase